MAKRRKKLKSLGRIKKLSTLLALALRDFAKFELAKNCQVNMRGWLYNSGGKCVGCLAGSVMRLSLQTPRDVVCSVILLPGDYDDATMDRLAAINALRGGYVASAALEMGIKTKVPYRDVPDYHACRNAWWEAMRNLLKDLRTAGE